MHRVDIKGRTPSTTLNAAAELQLAHATLHLPSAASPISLASSFDTTAQRVTYTIPDVLDVGIKAELRVVLTGKLTDSMVDYYNSSSPGGIYALTQFEPTDARRAISCWDEPLLKATFGATMILCRNTVSLCNMSALDEPPAAQLLTEVLLAGIKEGKWVATKFATSLLVHRAAAITLLVYRAGRADVDVPLRARQRSRRAH
jgi:aminopeptidase 2